MDTFIEYAPIIGLLFFFILFAGIAMWVLHPANKRRLAEYAHIPLKEENNERE